MTGQTPFKFPELSPIGFNKFMFGEQAKSQEPESPKFSSSSTANGSIVVPFSENESPPYLRQKNTNRFSKAIQLEEEYEFDDHQQVITDRLSNFYWNTAQCEMLGCTLQAQSHCCDETLVLESCGRLLCEEHKGSEVSEIICVCDDCHARQRLRELHAYVIFILVFVILVALSGIFLCGYQMYIRYSSF